MPPSRDPRPGLLLELRDLLSQTFPSESRLDQVVYRAFTTRVHDIAKPGTLRDQAFQVVQYAQFQRTNGVPRLVRAALEEAPASGPLKSFEARATAVDWTLPGPHLPPEWTAVWPGAIKPSNSSTIVPPQRIPAWLLAVVVGGLAIGAIAIVVAFVLPNLFGGGGGGTSSMVEVPKVKGLSAVSAGSILDEAGLRVEIERRENRNVDIGDVIRTEPEEGTQVPRESIVRVYVSWPSFP
jgi:hypothetical protein